MKYLVMCGTVPIQCATPSQAVAVAKEIDSTRRLRANNFPHDDDNSSLSSAIAALRQSGRRFFTVLLQYPEGLSMEEFSAELGYKKPEGVEGSVSAVKGFLKRRGAAYSNVIEENSQNGRTFRIRPKAVSLVKKALEIQ